MNKRFAFKTWLIGSIAILILLSGALCVKMLSSEDQRFKKDRFNVFLVTVDTLRADQLGCYGYRFDTSPNIDRLAKESLIYLRHFAHSSLTSPSVATIMTSLYPHENGVITNKRILRKELPTLAKILSGYGYLTSELMG